MNLSKVFEIFRYIAIHPKVGCFLDHHFLSMKFKATWKSESVSIVSPAIIAVLKGGGGVSTDASIIKLSQTQFSFTNGTRRRDQSESWCSLSCNHCFSSVICESLRDNFIDVSIPTQSLIMVLRYVAQSVQCTMRLTKRNGSEPIMRFEFNFVDSGNCLVVHDVPIEIIKQEESIWSEPLIPDADTRLVLSYPVRRILVHLEQIRHMDPDARIGIRFENFASFSNISLECTCESVRTKLKVPNQQVFQPTQTDENRMTGVPVISDVCIMLKGIIFALERVSSLNDTCKCLLLASANKYLSFWIQLPNQYGSVAAISPAVIIE